jgi:flagellin-like protein
MHKLFKSKKAVSPVIASVLMILVVMIGMTLLFAYLTTYTAGFQAGIGSSVLESITVEDIWLNSTAGSHSYADGHAKIWVYNTGEIDLTINAIYVNGLSLTNGTSNFNFNIQVKVGEHVPIVANYSSTWVSNGVYDFKISTQRGSNFETKYTAP